MGASEGAARGTGVTGRDSEQACVHGSKIWPGEVACQPRALRRRSSGGCRGAGVVGGGQQRGHGAAAVNYMDQTRRESSTRYAAPVSTSIHSAGNNGGCCDGILVGSKTLATIQRRG